MTTRKRMLVTGAGGRLGRAVSEVLLAGGEEQLAVGSRDPRGLEALKAQGAEPRHVDFDEPASLDAAFAGVERLLIVSTDQLGVPGLRQRQHRAALDAALHAGVRHIAYTSMPSPGSSTSIPFASDHLDMEEALARSGAAFSILRNGWYQENLLAFLPAIVASGTWFTAAGYGRIPYVSRDDVARCAAAVLAADAEPGTHDIAGSPALTIEEIAAATAKAVDRPIRVVHVPQSRLADELARQGMPDAVVPLVAMTDANQRAGRFDVGAGAVATLTGRTPRSLDDFLLANVAALLAHPAR